MLADRQQVVVTQKELELRGRVCDRTGHLGGLGQEEVTSGRA